MSCAMNTATTLTNSADFGSETNMSKAYSIDSDLLERFHLPDYEKVSTSYKKPCLKAVLEVLLQMHAMNINLKAEKEYPSLHESVMASYTTEALLILSQVIRNFEADVSYQSRLIGKREPTEALERMDANAKASRIRWIKTCLETGETEWFRDEQWEIAERLGYQRPIAN